MTNHAYQPSPPRRVTVLRGGPSAEREISLASGHAVATAARKLGHLVTEADVAPDDLDALDVPADIIFPVLHGRFGEDGELQQILEQRGLSFVGSGSEASRIGMDKHASKTRWQAAGLPTAPWALVDRSCASLPDGLQPPCVVKPLTEGSSIGVCVCDTAESLARVLPRAIAAYGCVLVEQWLEGPELTVGILGRDPLPVIQIRPATGFYDFTAKYERHDTDFRLDPPLEGTTCKAIQQLAARAFDVLGCRHLGRVDLIVDRRTGPQLLEINTLPGFTDHSLVPKAAAHAGIAFDRLVDMLLEMAWTGRDEAGGTRR